MKYATPRVSIASLYLSSDMNSAVKALIFNHCCIIKASFFHSTPFLERKRRNFWDSTRQNNNNSKRQRKVFSKHEKLRNINAHADFLFQSWRSDCSQEDGPFSNKGPSCFKRDYTNPRKNRTSNQGPRFTGKRGSGFCENDDEEYVDVEMFFRSAFGGNSDRVFFWSFVNEDCSQRGRSSNHTFKRGNSWRQRFEYTEDDDGSSTYSELSHSNVASNRKALGLRASGPLKLEEVKSAYRACALKWHPDRHQGSSKVVAEEKFKLCSAAYQSLCDKLAVD